MAKKKKRVNKNSFNPYRLIIYIILFAVGYSVYRCGAPKAIGSIDRLEIPATGISTTGTIIAREGYTLSYNSKRLIPDWVAYELTATETEGDEPRAKHFRTDPEIAGLQADNDDYRNSGWDKGHMAPAADMKWSEKAMDECFYLSNICPQDHKLNTGVWKSLEEKCREYARYFGKVYIVCGPIVGNNRYGTIGENGVMVPDAFFKVLLASHYDKYTGIGFIFENKKGAKKFMDHAVTIDEVERVTGIDFFHALPDDIEKQAESTIDKAVWSK